MVWHRNTIGILVQRLLFAVTLLVAMIVFCNQYERPQKLNSVIVKAFIPLILVLAVVCLKVSRKNNSWRSFD